MEKNSSTHKPAALRKVGFSAYRNYAIWGVVALIFMYFVSSPQANKIPWDTWNIPEGFSAYGKEIIRFFLLVGAFSLFIYWVFFASKISIFYFRFFKDFQEMSAALSVFYLVSVIYSFAWPLTTASMPLLVILFVLIGFLGVQYYLEQKMNRPKTFFSLIGVFGWIAIFLSQFWHKDPYFWPLFWMLVAPFLIFYSKNIWLIFKEYFKELPWYRYVFVWGKRGESSRWGGLRQYYQMDFTGWFDKNRQSIQKTELSEIYLGKTFFDLDTRIGGRHIGTTSEQHLITIAGTRSGKSRDSIWNTLLNYNHGVICFDPKGEHTTVTRNRRKKFADFHTLDPFNVVTDEVIKPHNPFDAIDPKSDTAYEQIEALAKSLIMDYHMYYHKSSDERYFDENVKIITTGFLANLLSDPKEDRTLKNACSDLEFILGFRLNIDEEKQRKFEDKVFLNMAIKEAPHKAIKLIRSISKQHSAQIFDTMSKATRLYYRNNIDTDSYFGLPKSNHSANWNPLNEIDVNSKQAWSQLTNFAEAALVEDVSGNDSEHFRNTGIKVIRGFAAYVLSSPDIPKEKKNMGTLFDLIVKGSSDGDTYDTGAMKDLIDDMMKNDAIDGAARDAASILLRVGEKERGSIFSTVSIAIEWMGTEASRNVTGSSDFEMASAKTNGASIYFVLPEKHIHTYRGLVRIFYAMALDVCDNTTTPQPPKSKKRVLFLFDEFSSLGHFKPLANKMKFAAGSFIKMWLICQNIEQITEVYSKPADFTGSADHQFFGIKRTDAATLKFIHEALGKYTEEQKGDKEDVGYGLLEETEISELLDSKFSGQIFIGDNGNPIKLRRIPFMKNHKKWQYGKNEHSKE